MNRVKKRSGDMNIRPQVLWFTGLSGSGKTTIGKLLRTEIEKSTKKVIMLDGDVLRNGLCGDLGFSKEDRLENIRRVSEVARLFLNQGFVVICTFISPFESARNMAREIIGATHFKEVYIDCPLKVCEERDVKGLYKKARAGRLNAFTGISSPYEAPRRPDIVLFTAEETVDDSCYKLMKWLLIN